LRDPTIVDRFFSEPLGLGAVIGGWDFYDTETLIEDVPSDDPDTGGGQRPGGAPVGGLGSATNFGFADWIISPGREGMSPGYAGEILNFIFSGGGIPGNPSG